MCGFVTPPSKFQDPDVDMHKQLDLRGKGTNPDGMDPNALGDANHDGLDDATGLPADDAEAAQDGALDQQPQLACPVCGEQFEAGHPQSVDTADPQSGGLAADGPAEGDLCPACGKGALESGTELAEQGFDPEADPNAIPDEDPDPHADEEGLSTDEDGDGIPDAEDPDADGDGIDDKDEYGGAPGAGDEDVDGDGTPDDEEDPDEDDDSDGPVRKSKNPFKQ